METLPITLQTVSDLPPNVTATTLWGITGEALRTEGDNPTLADLETLTFPALRALGIEVSLCEIPEDDIALKNLVRERLRWGVRVPLLQTTLLTANTNDAAENSDETPLPQILQILGGKILTETPDDCAVLRTFGQFLLVLKRARTKGKRRNNRDDLLLRYAAFAAAYPQRIVTATARDNFRRRLCAEYFASLGGRQNTPRHRRLRHIAEHFDCGDISHALEILHKIALDILDLPDAMHYALLETDRPLDPIERRELIYLARAGTLFPKILALRRLHSETEHAEVRATLHQLTYDSHLWARNTAK